MHNSFQPFTLADNHIFMYQFPIKSIQESRWDQDPTYTSYCSALATCCISDTSLFKVHFKFLLLTEVASIVINLQPRVWNLGISHIPSLPPDGYWVYLPLTPTVNENHKHRYNGCITITTYSQVSFHHVCLISVLIHCYPSHWHPSTGLSDWKR